ncbi:flavin reductase [Mycolicibacterium sp. P9-64]|uniref:flavin reductase family protein n=1 Tax=Mycolicibacterium sp. P9-64 TaxID=2024612 RepID=UPI0011F08171|nr:flavin reductase family protein [Mycolicibacterium sp. P9-64]KAA0082705.1 flavin reductase [Mycolicibacterium sp. P9-64]
MQRSSTQVSATELRRALAHFPTGVAVITGKGDGDAPAGLTIQSFMSLSLDPPMILISIDRRSTSWPTIAARRLFAVNILAAQQEALATAFARSGRSKFDGVSWETGPHSGSPLIVDSRAWVECRIAETYDGGDHVIITADVLGLGTSDDPQPHSLVFYRSRFPHFDPEHWCGMRQ